jgi:hypothetical protein
MQFGSSPGIAKWPVGDLEEGALRFSNEELMRLIEWNPFPRWRSGCSVLTITSERGASEKRR